MNTKELILKILKMFPENIHRFDTDSIEKIMYMQGRRSAALEIVRMLGYNDKGEFIEK